MSAKSPRPGRHLDWSEIHARCARTAAVLRGDVAPSPEQVQAVLDGRARALAQVPARPPEAAEMIAVITFALGAERLALETRYVRRVLGRWTATPVPGAPDGLLGVTNLHGDVLALFDPRPLFGAARGGPAAGAQLLVLGESRDELGLVIDAVIGVGALRIAALREPAVASDRPGRGLVRGVTDEAVIVVDGAALLADERLFVQQGDEPGA